MKMAGWPCWLPLICLWPLPLAAQNNIAVKAAWAYLGNGQIIKPALVLVEGKRISGVGDNLKLPPGTKVLDLGEGVLCPGFVDGLSYAGLPKGVAQNEEGSEVTPAYRVSEALDTSRAELRWLWQQGVTTLGVHPGARNVVGGLVCCVKTGGGPKEELMVRDAVGLRISLGPDPAVGNRGMNFGLPGLKSRLPLSRMDTIYLVRQAFQDARQYRQERERNQDQAKNPGLEILLSALAGRLPVFWLARGEKDIHGALDLIQELGLPRNVVVDAWEAPVQAAGLKARAIPVLLGPLIHPESHWGGRRREAMQHHMWDAARLHAAGILCAFSHGAAAAGDTLVDSARFAVRGGLDSRVAMTWLTLNGARILGVDKRLGSLEIGKDADLVVWSGDPLLPTSRVRMVMIGGRVLEGGGSGRPLRKKREN